MTEIVVLALTLGGAVSLLGVGAPRVVRSRRRSPVNPVTRQPDRAELSLAPSGRDDGLPHIPPKTSPRPALHAVAATDAPRMFGYASWDGRNGGHARDFRGQAERIVSETNRLEIRLLEIIREREPQRGRALERPGLGYALDSISAGDAEGLVVDDLSRLTRSAAELGRVLQWFLDHDARLVAIGQGLDTDDESARLAVRMLIDVSRWEHERLVERTRNGMRAARRKGPPGVADYPHLKERIAQMRAAGMTLEAIAGQLNREGTPTVRGGAKWRPSSVQVAAGYRRPPAGHRNHANRDAARARANNGQP